MSDDSYRYTAEDITNLCDRIRTVQGIHLEELSALLGIDADGPKW